MHIFTSSREKRLWQRALFVFAAIFSTLFIGRPVLNFFSDQKVQAGIFLLGMILIGGVIITHAIKTKPAKAERVLWFGIAAVYILLILRLGLPERSHLIEYSILAICIHMALVERANQIKELHKPALISWVIALTIGVIDEVIQLLVPERVFDPIDILFNAMAISLAIGFAKILAWFRNRKPKQSHYSQ